MDGRWDREVECNLQSECSGSAPLGRNTTPRISHVELYPKASVFFLKGATDKFIGKARTRVQPLGGVWHLLFFKIFILGVLGNCTIQ